MFKTWLSSILSLKNFVNNQEKMYDINKGNTSTIDYFIFKYGKPKKIYTLDDNFSPFSLDEYIYVQTKTVSFDERLEFEDNGKIIVIYISNEIVTNVFYEDIFNC